MSSAIAAFAEAKQALLAFLGDRGAGDVEIVLSGEPPRADPVSGKYKHIYRDTGWELA